ncbi:MAG TPA: hemerythrin domain-containing protein [Gammaproteobacteria bacterium]|nr:hemerythrin domain-containing protein [Gammaproteobacteria bacterium]
MRALKSRGFLLTMMVTSVALLVLVTATANGHPAFDNSQASDGPPSVMEASVKFPIPDSVIAEHAALHAELEQIIHSGGKTGQAAQAVAAVLEPHFVKEEKYALPPLALLGDLAGGKLSPQMAAILPLTDELKRSLPQMLAEHQQIVTALNHLSAVAKAEHKTDAERFAHELIHHAQTEEQITYPAAILVGEYVRLRLSTGGASADN